MYCNLKARCSWNDNFPPESLKLFDGYQDELAPGYEWTETGGQWMSNNTIAMLKTAKTCCYAILKPAQKRCISILKGKKCNL